MSRDSSSGNVTVSDEVAQALASNRPVAALETAVLTHGLPHPHNIDIIKRMQCAVRESGSVPAVIGFIDGELIAGINDAQIEQLGVPGATPLKISTRDIGFAFATEANGGTTVAATLVAAKQAGIHVFATGGIGGVHRGWRETLDISADIDELARTPCCVVCSGAKAILDLPATFEALESRGIPVLGYQTDVMPQFYSRGSDALRVPHQVDDVEMIASICARHWYTGRQQAVIIANPVPQEFAIAHDEMDTLIERAVVEAQSQNIQGAALTPFLLDFIASASNGRAMQANLALLESNARLAGRLAVELNKCVVE